MAGDGPLDLKSLRDVDPRFGDDVADLLDVRTSLSRRKTHGGPPPEAVRAQLVRAHDAVGLQRYSLSKHAECVELVDNLLKGEPRWRNVPSPAGQSSRGTSSKRRSSHL